VRRKENADIRARVTGYLQKRDYQEGSYVKAGNLLFEIDPRPFEAALAEAKSQLLQAQALQLETQADFERAQELFNKKVISEQEFHNKQQLNEANVADEAIASRIPITIRCSQLWNHGGKIDIGAIDGGHPYFA
jgi:multidrug efflux pump subunit AcrA (membrane-fusion protein)